MAEYSGRGLHGQTVEEIGRRILDGRIAEGATLDVPALEAELDISLTVVREALRVLAAKGLVDARQRRGTFVRPRESWNLLDSDVIRWQLAGSPAAAFLADLAEVRAVVEPSAARLAALRHRPADLEALRGALHDMAAAAGTAAAVAADLRFHRALLDATHNELLRRMEVVLTPGLAERDRLVHGSGHHDDPVPAHAAVVDAVAAGDPVAAETAMRRLLHQAGEDLRLLTRPAAGPVPPTPRRRATT